MNKILYTSIGNIPLSCLFFAYLNAKKYKKTLTKVMKYTIIYMRDSFINFEFAFLYKGELFSFLGINSFFLNDFYPKENKREQKP